MADVLAHQDHKNASRILNLPAPASPNEPAINAQVQAIATGGDLALIMGWMGL